MVEDWIGSQPVGRKRQRQRVRERDRGQKKYDNICRKKINIEKENVDEKSIDTWGMTQSTKKKIYIYEGKNDAYICRYINNVLLLVAQAGDLHQSKAQLHHR